MKVAILIGLIAVSGMLIWYLDTIGKKRISNYVKFALIAFVAIVVFVAVATPLKITFNNNNISLNGMYGVEVNYDDIESIELVKKQLSITRKSNGTDFFGLMYNGHFNVAEYGKCSLYMQKNKAPYLVIKCSDKYIIYNNNDENVTQEYYSELAKRIKNE